MRAWRGLTVVLAIVVWGLGLPHAIAQTPGPSTTAGVRCAGGTCPPNIGGAFVWHDSDTTVSGQFTGSVVLFPQLAQVPCATAASFDTSRPPGSSGPGGPPHLGFVVPFPFIAPAADHPLAAFIDLADYHGPGTYTNAAFAHQTYAYPAGVRKGIQTAPVEQANAAWSITVAADGSGSLTYSGPPQNPGPTVPKGFQINLLMSWKCDDQATPQVLGGPAVSPTTVEEGLPLPPAPERNRHTRGVNVLLEAVAVISVLALGAVAVFVVARKRRRRRRPSCSCSGSVTIAGRDNLEVCECSHLSWEFIVVSVDCMHLIARGPDGRPAFARQYQASLVTECEGDSSLSPAAYTWTVQATATAVMLSVTATQSGTCSDGSPVTINETGTFTITLRPAKCMVAIVICDHHALFEVNHVAMRITCGEYDTVFDYGPAATFKMVRDFAGCPGVAEAHTGCTPEQSLGRDLHGFQPNVDRRLYYLPNVTCAMCDGLRTFWLGVMGSPGTYQLLTNSCVSHVTAALAAVGYPDPSITPLHPEGGGAVTPLALENQLQEHDIIPELFPPMTGAAK